MKGSLNKKSTRVNAGRSLDTLKQMDKVEKGLQDQPAKAQTAYYGPVTENQASDIPHPGIPFELRYELSPSENRLIHTGSPESILEELLYRYSHYRSHDTFCHAARSILLNMCNMNIARN